MFIVFVIHDLLYIDTYEYIVYKLVEIYMSLYIYILILIIKLNIYIFYII